MKRWLEENYNWLVFLLIVMAGVSLVFWSPLTKSAEVFSPLSAKLAYITEDFRVWCESPSGGEVNGNKIYVSKVGLGTGGVHMVVIPGGCK